jgi:hypothetical protein
MGKSSKPVIGYWYRPAFHHGLTIGEIDAFLEFRGGDKTAWQGELTASGTISVNAPNLWGGEKDQGGIVGDLAVMFGEPTQVPNPYLVSVFGDQTAAWRGFATVAFLGGRYGAMNPYPQPASYKIRRILEGWDGGVAWYPEKAVIGLAVIDAAFTDISKYKVEPSGSTANYSAPDFDDSTWTEGQGAFGSAVYGADAPTINTTIAWHAHESIWLRSRFGFAASSVAVEVRHDDTATFWWNGEEIPLTFVFGDALNTSKSVATIPANKVLSNNVAVLKVIDVDPSAICAGIKLQSSTTGLFAANPAHVLFESRTNGDMGREPVVNINDASLRAAADKLYAEGFGICPKWDPSSESVEDFEQRICKLIGGSFSRSLEDGQWYLDLARGDYVLEDLPILTDDDILEFKEQPSTFDNAINSVSVRYFDPEKKETIVTAPVRALGLVTAFGTIHQTYDFPEIPTAGLAMIVALRELLATTTPTRAFDLVTTRKPYAWRPDQYFRLQAPKRGIADMVCLVGEKQSGTLKSGAIKLKATQDIYSLPATSFVQVEPGVDPRPAQTPNAITLQRTFEAPYVEVAASMSRSDLAALTTEAGFAMAVAAPPAGEIDFTLMVAPSGGSYDEAGHGEWAATATIVESGIGKTDTDFTLAAGVRLDRVTVGMGALWDDEIVRVDAIDASAGTITLARGCADTVPFGAHAAGSRLWFYEVGFAFDATEYTDGETVDVKLLSNTGSQQLPLASASAMALTFDQRVARPYPPGNVQIGGLDWPSSASGAFTVSWAHRDRGLQADQLVDTTAASIGPESTVRYGLSFEDAGTAAVIVERTDLGDDAATVQLGASAPASVRMKLWSISDNGDSWQTHEHVFAFSGGSGAPSIDGGDYIPPPDAVIVDGNDPPPVTGGGSPPTPAPGGAGAPGTPTARTIGSTVVVPTLATGTGAATSNSAAINAAFAGFTAGVGGIVRTPAGDYYVDPAHPIKPLSNCALDLETNGTTLRATNGGLSQGSSFTLHKDLVQVVNSVHDVEIHGGHLIGFRDAWAVAGGTSFYTPGTSEWNHAIYIGDSAHDISVYRLSASKCTGDGISIGRTAYNVHVLNVLSTDNRRQGISAAGISASANIKIETCECSYIGVGDGTSPMAGIDCEVDTPSVNSTSGIQIISCHLHHNNGPGLICYKSVNNITISNLISEYNSKGIYGVDSDNVTISGTSKIRYNKYEGLHLRGSCSNWSVRADFFDNKTKRYGAPSGSTTTSPSSTLKSKNVTVETTVTGLTYDPTTTWGAV